MTPEQMRKITGFATGLGKLKAKEGQGQGCEPTPDEVAGVIWGVQQLRGSRKGDEHEPAAAS